MNSKSVKRIKKKKTAYWLLSFISHLMPTQVILETVHERRFSGTSEEEGCLLTLAKGISLKWICERESVFKPGHKTYLVCAYNFFSSWFDSKECANYSSISTAFIKLCAIHERIAMMLSNGQVNWNLPGIEFLFQYFWQKKKNCTNVNN